MKKTKVVEIIKDDIELDKLTNFINSGVDAFYITYECASKSFLDSIKEKIDKLNKTLKKNVALILETKGPRIFTGKFQNGSALFNSGDKIRIYMDDSIGDSTKLSVSYPGVIDDIRTNTIMKVGSSLVEFKVIEKYEDNILCEVVNGGVITDNSYIALIDTTIDMPYLGEDDVSLITYASKIGIDYISLSLVHSSEDVLCVNDLLISLRNDTMGILVKADNEKTIDDIDQIMKVCDGIVASNKDLEAEIRMERIPAIQKSIIHKCHMQGKISLIYLDLNESRQVKPNQAELNGIISAILESPDSVLIDTAQFQDNDVNVVGTLNMIIESAESDINYYELLDKSMRTESQDTTGWIAYSVTECAMRLRVKTIVAPTVSGYTAKKISRFRPNCPIIALTPSYSVAKSLSLYYGIYVYVEDGIKSFDSMMDISHDLVKKLFIAHTSDKFIITGGYPFKNVKHTNFMKIEEV